MHVFDPKAVLLFLLYAKLLAAAPAVDQPTYEPGVLYLPDKAISLDDGYRLSIQGVFGGIVLISCGLLLIFRSLWDRTPAGTRTQSLTGFITMGFVTWVMLANFEPSSTYGVNRQTIYFIVPFVVGLVTTCFMAVTIQLYLALLGGLGGLGFGLWILGWKDDLSITSNYGRAILLTVLVVVFMVLALYSCVWHKLGAAIAGSYLFFMGLDIFFHTGFLYCFTTSLDSNHDHDYRVYRNVYIMQACLIVAILVSYVIQNFGHRPEHIRLQHSIVMGTLQNPLYKPQPVPGNSFIPATMIPTWRRPTFPFFNRTAPPPPTAV
ncbi:hypothetical protein EDC96DRAFT_491690 [Choanephora cucurbitarum]|nr:hypothetical protein EDC96DRAFT_491690 [Choanephora cucurbitarum]